MKILTLQTCHDLAEVGRTQPDGPSDRLVAQIPQCTSPIPHNTLFCNRNVHRCARFCYKIVHFGIFVWYHVGFVRWVNSALSNFWHICWRVLHRYHIFNYVMKFTAWTLNFTGHNKLKLLLLLKLEKNIYIALHLNTRVSPTKGLLFYNLLGTGWKKIPGNEGPIIYRNPPWASSHTVCIM